MMAPLKVRRSTMAAPTGYRRWRSLFAFLVPTLVGPAALALLGAAFLLIAKG
jgi:hypothetical protein